MDKKQTAVEWYEYQTKKLIQDYTKRSVNGAKLFIESQRLFEEAKQMEKEQMIEFANTYGTRVCNHDYENGEQYYNETFKQQDK